MTPEIRVAIDSLIKAARWIKCEGRAHCAACERHRAKEWAARDELCNLIAAAIAGGK